MNSYSGILKKMAADISDGGKRPRLGMSGPNWDRLREALLRAAEGDSEEAVETLIDPYRYAARDSYKVEWPAFWDLVGAIQRAEKKRAKLKKK